MTGARRRLACWGRRRSQRLLAACGSAGWGWGLLVLLLTPASFCFAGAVQRRGAQAGRRTPLLPGAGAWQRIAGFWGREVWDSSTEGEADMSERAPYPRVA